MRVFAMTEFRTRTRPPRHLAWLLWFALLLPIAQAAATWHTVSHTAQALAESADLHDKQAPDAGHCDLCLNAAAIHGGALPSTPVVFTQGSARHEAPALVLTGVSPGSPTRTYQSRAPPAPRTDC
jgi:hypothetical protein